jgi:putative peptide zinc metalloprotease protein
MNLTRVLNVALPEIPARALSDRPPRVPIDTVAKEHIEDGKPVTRVLVRGQDAMYRFTPAQWTLAQLFDGQHNYEEIAEAYSNIQGQEYDADEMREFAASVEAMDFWYKSPQEKNILLMQKSAEERRNLVKSRKSRFGDLSEIKFPAVNPDKFVTWLYKQTKFIYTGWFSVLTVVAFLVMIGISVTHWDEIGHDTLEFFTFTDKSAGDFIVFYVLALATMCWHELGHAHVCKHYGARVPAMGFLLIYLTPAFYTDTTEGFVKATRPQRFIIAMAGAHAELLLCALATPVWWGTAPGTALHSAAYQLMLMTGIAGVLLNWNPLMKLDGYFMLTEAIGIAELKEESTAYVSAWVKRHIWRLPVEVPYVPKSRRLGFAVYALLSGAYSYTVLYVLARFAGNVFRNFNPEWSFIPEIVTAALIFRSRIRKLVEFMKFVYLDKKDRILAWFRARTGMATAIGGILFLLMPFWHESAKGRFFLEPGKVAVVRNAVPGVITEVLAQEGMSVEKGTMLLRLRNTPLESRMAAEESSLEMASSGARKASMQYANLGSALQERSQIAERNRELQLQARSLELVSPIAGTVLNHGVSDRMAAYIPEGTDLVEVANLREMRARIYISDYEMFEVHLGSSARLHVEGLSRLWEGTVMAISPVASGIDPKIAEKAELKGLNPLNFYAVDLVISNEGEVLKPGMTGLARIYGQRRSLLGLAGKEALRFIGRKFW